MPYKDPDRQRSAKAEHARRKRSARVEPNRGTRTRLVSGELRLATARDVLALIDDQAAAVLDDQELATCERARTIATLAGLALRAIEAAGLAARVEALERALQARSAAP